LSTILKHNIILFKGISKTGTVLQPLNPVPHPFIEPFLHAQRRLFLLDPKAKNPPSELYTGRCTIFCKTRGFIQEKKYIFSRIPYPPIIKTGGRGYVNAHVKKKSKVGL